MSTRTLKRLIVTAGLLACTVCVAAAQTRSEAKQKVMFAVQSMKTLGTSVADQTVPQANYKYTIAIGGRLRSDKASDAAGFLNSERSFVPPSLNVRQRKVIITVSD